MAGISFELQKILKDKNDYLSTIRAYVYAGLIGSGPWIISIFGITLLGVAKTANVLSHDLYSSFQISIIYLIAVSLILSSITQYSFTRFISDKIYAQEIEKIAPNFNGILFLMTVFSGIISLIAVHFLFPNQSFLYCILMSGSFVVLCLIWLVASLLTGLKNYNAILLSFFIGYGLVVLLVFLLKQYQLEGLLFAFFVGQFFLLMGLIITLIRQYPSQEFIRFDFLSKGEIFYSFVFSSLFYNLAIWADKFLFWLYPTVSHSVFGPLRESVIYDTPMFLAYLTIIPGMAIFLLHVETDFVDYYKRYYNAIEKGFTLSDILDARFHMVAAARRSIFAIFRVQGMTTLAFIMIAPAILSVLHLSKLYMWLFNVDLISAGLLVVFISLLNILCYLDKRNYVMILCFLFFMINTVGTWLSLRLGVFYFGYGFASSLLIVDIIAFILVDRNFNSLEYYTFYDALRIAEKMMKLRINRA